MIQNLDHGNNNTGLPLSDKINPLTVGAAYVRVFFFC